MKNKLIFLKSAIVFLAISFIMQSCMDVIDVNLPAGEPLVVIDAWVNNMEQAQVIKLSYASPYFESATPPPLSGATVTIVDQNSNLYFFVEEGTSGEYIWEDTNGGVFGSIGESYELVILTSVGNYRSFSSMNRVPTVDSFTYEEYEVDFGGELQEEGWEAEFYARDFEGEGDTYWIKSFRNDEFLAKPQELNYAYDAGFSDGSAIDGITFIGPIRSWINRVPDTGDDAVDTNEYPPFVSGDKIKVEIHSMTNDGYEFLNEAYNQMTLGDNTIFAPPLVNIPTNIVTESGIQAVGCFNVGAVELLEEFVP